MGYIIQDTLLYLKDIVRQTGYQMLKTQNLIVVVFTIGGAAVSWKSSKQMVIAISTMEEAEWLRHFLKDIPRWQKHVSPICIHCDSQSSIGRVQNSMYNGNSTHICRRHNTIKQLLSMGVISLDFVKSKDNIADLLTKGLN